MRISNSFSFKDHEKKSLCGSFLRAPGQQPSLSSEFEFGEGDKLDLGSEFEFDKPDELGLETNSYSETYSPETLNSNSNELGNSHQK